MSLLSSSPSTECSSRSVMLVVNNNNVHEALIFASPYVITNKTATTWLDSIVEERETATREKKNKNKNKQLLEWLVLFLCYCCCWTVQTKSGSTVGSTCSSARKEEEEIPRAAASHNRVKGGGLDSTRLDCCVVCASFVNSSIVKVRSWGKLRNLSYFSLRNNSSEKGHTLINNGATTTTTTTKEGKNMS